MIPSFQIDLASAGDDPELRRVLRENSMDGEIAVSFQREPDYFRATAIEGHEQQVIVLRERANPTRIGGVATRSIRPMFVNGQLRRVGYLSGLRGDREFRGSLGLARGWRFLRKLHESDPVPLYVSTIIEGNRAAVELLTSGRAGLPIYRDIGRMRTFSVSPRRRRRMPRVAGLEVVRGAPGLLPGIVSCLERHGATRQFAPRFAIQDFRSGSPLVPDFELGDFFVALRGGRVVGTLARWDQGGFKQTVVMSYGGKMRWIRPVYGVAARLGRFAPLPAPGQPFRYCYASFLSVEDEDPDVLRALLAAFHNDVLALGYGFFMAALHERDPLYPVLHENPFVPYDARIYVVYWPDGEVAANALDERPPKLDVAVL